MLKINEGEPWVMWPDLLVANFIDYPANKILDYNGNFEFNMVFELLDNITKKSTLFAKLPTYVGIDLEDYGVHFIVTSEDGEIRHFTHNYKWEVGKIYDLVVKRNNNIVTVTINNETIFECDFPKESTNQDYSHILFGAGNFPKNDFNLNYFSFIFHYLTIKKEGMTISEHDFKTFIHNKSFDLTQNCNFIHKI